MPRSTSKTERPDRRSTQPQPPPPELSGPIVPVPDIDASGPAVSSDRPGGKSAPDRQTPAARPRNRRPVRPQRTPPRLADTSGPEPSVPPERVRLTIGTILAPHGVRGEFKVRLQTDEPEHLQTIKRIYLGDEASPRTVLGVRLHAGNALMRVQGISTPETVERFRGTPLRIRGADARPLAANEYFLYQVIGLDVFDEAGNTLGRVTDLIETGADNVLVVTPEDGGADLLFPSHPEVVMVMDPAAGRIVVRPLNYYGEQGCDNAVVLDVELEADAASDRCVFCAIVGGEAPAEIVLTDPAGIAFLDSRPLLPGHVLLVPRTHVTTLPDLPVTDVGPFFTLVQRLTQAVPRATGAEGAFVAINNVVSQSVPHLHVHVVPRRHDDRLFGRNLAWTRRPYRDHKEMKHIADAIRSSLRDQE